MKNHLQVISTILILIVFSCGILTKIDAQHIDKSLVEKIEKPRSARVMFYNCENLFDYLDDTLKNDEEFLPHGERFWTRNKYYEKLNHISKVITAIGGWTPPEIVGLCEIENQKVVNDLIRNSPLYRFEYKAIHKESPDKRGIDVALLYQPRKFQPLKVKFVPVIFPDDSTKKTRDILYAKGILNSADTLHIFVNHWPSRWGGELESESYRLFVASVLKHQTDSVLKDNPKANIIIGGDFNDEPHSKSITSVLCAQKPSNQVSDTVIYNLSHPNQNRGTHKFQGTWAILDQILVSGNLLNTKNPIFTSAENYNIFIADFLLTEDQNYLGYKPFRTYNGYAYQDGFSDHLPVFVDLNKN